MRHRMVCGTAAMFRNVLYVCINVQFNYKMIDKG
jgi:hypothetical protein